MSRLQLLLIAAFAGLGLSNVHAAPLGDCSFESDNISGRSDVVFCEPLESSTWWSDNGYVENGGKPPTDPVSADQMEYTSIIEGPECLEGKCLKVDTPLGKTRSLSIHWPLSNAGIQPEELYMRYYFKIGSEWTAEACDAGGNTVWPSGGKFWGLADARDSQDASGQCGNGGSSSDGINCWSARGGYAGCSVLDGVNTCNNSPGAKLRMGSYIYVPDNGTSHGANGFSDGVAERQSLGDDYSSSCRRDRESNRNPDCYCKSENNFYCGISYDGQLRSDQWYAIEYYVKMNTVGQADGILRGWIDDKLTYEKTNMRFRLDGHDNLHVRTLWLNTYKGGTFGNCEDSELYYDQMVVATEKIGALDIVRPDTATGVSATEN